MGNISRTTTLVKNTGWTYVAKIATQIFSLLVAILVIRKLDVAMFGTFSLLIGTKVIIDILATIPFTAIYTRYIPELSQSKNFFQIWQLAKRGFLLGLSAGLVLIFLFSLFREPFANLFKIPDFNNYLLSFSLFLLCNQVNMLTDGILKALLLHKFAAFANIFASVLRSILYVALISVLNVTILLYIEALVALGQAILGLIIYFKYMKRVEHNQTDIHPVNQVDTKRMTKYGFYSALNELGAGVVGSASDFYIVAAMTGQYYVGLYAFANKLYGMIFQILPYKDFLSVLKPLFIQKFTEDQTEKTLVDMYNFIVKIVLPLYTFPAVIFLIFGQHIIELIFDPKYTDAYWVTVLMLSGNFFTGLFYPLGLVMSLKERMDLALLGKVVLVITLPASIFAIQYFGILGLVTTTVIGNGLKYITMFLLLQKTITITYRLNQYWKYVLFEFVIIIVFFSLNPLIYNLASLLVALASFCFLSIIPFVVFHPFTKDELNILVRLAETNAITKRIFRLYASRSHS